MTDKRRGRLLLSLCACLLILAREERRTPTIKKMKRMVNWSATLDRVSLPKSSCFLTLPHKAKENHDHFGRNSYKLLLLGFEMAKTERKFAPLPSFFMRRPWRPYSSLIPSVIISLLFAVPIVSSHRRHDRGRVERVRQPYARLHGNVSWCPKCWS